MLNIAKTHAHMGKISNNLENHGDEEVIAFDVEISGIERTIEQINQLLDDPHADDYLFNRTKTGDIEPTDKIFEARRLRDSFEKAVVAISIGLGDKPLEFTLRDCKIKGVTIETQNGGTALVSFRLRIRPETDKQIIALMGHQNREIQIDVAEAAVAEKGGRTQQVLDFEGRDGAGKDPDASNDEHAKAGEAQAAALKNSKAA